MKEKHHFALAPPLRRGPEVLNQHGVQAHHGVSGFPSLYDTNSLTYRDLNMRSEAWRQSRRIVGVPGPRATNGWALDPHPRTCGGRAGGLQHDHGGRSDDDENYGIAVADATTTTASSSSSSSYSELVQMKRPYAANGDLSRLKERRLRWRWTLLTQTPLVPHNLNRLSKLR
ncbi:hypothetical protein INR49_004873 [Caranx melampygus]|nr:hypothetical protein INR49_004873 [Caranx melampygus]